MGAEFLEEGEVVGRVVGIDSVATETLIIGVFPAGNCYQR